MVSSLKLLTAAVACLFMSTAMGTKADNLRAYGSSRKPMYGGNFDGTQNPVIGVVSQTLEDEMKVDPRFSKYQTYIMKSYVTWLESVGARVIPLIRGEQESVTLDKLSKVNAVLFPGGDGDYLEYGRFIFSKVK